MLQGIDMQEKRDARKLNTQSQYELKKQVIGTEKEKNDRSRDFRNCRTWSGSDRSYLV